MLHIPGEVHFWTSKDDISIPETDFGAFRYHEKKEAVESLYLESKKSYASGRGITWAVSSKKSSPVKKESLKELEEQLCQQRVVKCEWRKHDVLQVVLSSGLLISVSINSGTGDIANTSFDKYMLSKLPSDCLTDVVFGQSHFVLAFSEAILCMVHLTHPLSPPEKLSRQEPRLVTFDLGGPSGRRLERKLSLSLDETMVLVWWRCSQDEVYPWSPVVRDCDRANILVYSILGSKLEMLCFYKTEGDPISVAFSNQNSNIILLEQQRVSRKGEVSVESSTFEVAAGGRLLRSPTVGSLQLQTQTCCIARSPDETRLALGCIDGSVLVHSSHSTLLAKAAFIPSIVLWHPDGSLVVIANEKGQLQSFDIALTPVRVQLLSEEPACTGSLLDLTTYFRYQPTLCFMDFNKKPVLEEFNDPYAPLDSFLLMHFDRGPFAILRLIGGGGLPGSLGNLSPDTLVSQYLRLDLVNCAINLLATLSWDTQGAICLACMHRVCNHLLALPLSLIIEEQLEAALGNFLSPSIPLSLAAERQFGRTMHHLARRFFHHLLRYQRFEKSFRLAIDLGDRDLFIDLFHSARGVGDETLAQAARQKASEIIDSASGSSSSSCDCSRSSCSECGSASSSDSEDPLVLAANKPTKVTFSDTVTHIVGSCTLTQLQAQHDAFLMEMSQLQDFAREVSSGDEEDGEDDETDVLIVSDTPLRHSGNTSTPISHPMTPNSTFNPQSDYTPHSLSTPNFLISKSMSITSSFNTNPSPLYSSSNLPSGYNTTPDSLMNVVPPTNYYSIISEKSTFSNSIPVSRSHDFFPDKVASLSIDRNSELRSSLSSIVPPPQVHRANITSLNPNKMSPLPRVKASSSVNIHAAKTSVATVSDSNSMTSLRVSETFRTSVPLSHSTLPHHDQYSSISNSNAAADTSMPYATVTKVYHGNYPTNRTPTSEFIPTDRTENSIYTTASSSNMSPTFSKTTRISALPLLNIDKPKFEPRSSESRSLLSLDGNSPLYLSPFPHSNQRKVDKPPLFKITSNSQHYNAPSFSKSMDDVRIQKLSKPEESRQFHAQTSGLETASYIPSRAEQSSMNQVGLPIIESLPLNLRDKVLLRKYGSDATPEEEESLTNIKVVHFGVV